MRNTPEQDDDLAFHHGFRRGVGAVVRGLLLVEADQVDVGALVGALSRYENELEAWIAASATEPDAEAPVWQPTAAEIGADEE